MECYASGSRGPSSSPDSRTIGFVVKVTGSASQSQSLTEVSDPLTPASPLSSLTLGRQREGGGGGGGSGWLEAAEGDLSRSYQRTVIRLLLLSYGVMAGICLLFFHTVPVGAFGTRLAEYPDVDPASDEYQQLKPVVVLLMVLVVVGLPTLMALGLWRDRRQQLAEPALWPEEAGASQGKKRLAVLQLTSMYRPSHWWMAPFNLSRRWPCRAWYWPLLTSVVHWC
jgi:hypothetical protein